MPGDGAPNGSSASRVILSELSINLGEWNRVMVGVTAVSGLAKANILEI
jgi:hypothetical protein